MPIAMKANDGQTDIYGLLFRPTTFDPTKKYPIVNNVYPGPQTGSTGSRSFSAARGDRQALAELGFIVVTIDGMGTPGRSNVPDAYAMGCEHDSDQIAGMTQLARSSGSIRAPASGGTRAAASPRPLRCSVSPTSSRRASPSRGTTTSG
jgi:dipeptidyl aminopeptidase/acylaminoacyl peptidase